MIIVKLQGGLGNQLFQYAFGLALKKKYNAKVAYDTKIFTRKASTQLTKRVLDIEKLTGKLPEVNHDKLKRYTWPLGIVNTIKYKLHILMGNLPTVEICDLSLVKGQKRIKNLYLNGYWQSEKYFLDCRAELLNSIEFKVSKAAHFISIYNELLKDNTTCSIHIRRGDYVTNEVYNNSFVQLTKVYYNLAIQKVIQQDTKTTFIVFSDDILWVKNHMKFDNAVYCSDENSALEDLHLMSLCNHNIIANSTFSWWGAWLNQNPNKVVVSPKYWFTDLEKNQNEIIPDSWLKIDQDEKN